MSKQETPIKPRTRSVGKSDITFQTTSKKSQVSPRRRPPSKSSAHKSVRMEERKFFTVEEDLQIMQHFSKYHEKQTEKDMAQFLARRLEHSEESIRDRIKRVISKLRQIDSKLLQEECRVKCDSPDPSRILCSFHKNQC